MSKIKQRRRPYIHIKTLTRCSLTVRDKLLRQKKNRTFFVIEHGANHYRHITKWSQDLVNRGAMTHSYFKPGIIRNGKYAI